MAEPRTSAVGADARVQHLANRLPGFIVTFIVITIIIVIVIILMIVTFKTRTCQSLNHGFQHPKKSLDNPDQEIEWQIAFTKVFFSGKYSQKSLVCTYLVLTNPLICSLSLRPLV